MTVRKENRIKILEGINCSSGDFIITQALKEKTGLNLATITSAFNQAGKHCFEPVRGAGHRRKGVCSLEQGEECLFIG